MVVEQPCFSAASTTVVSVVHAHAKRKTGIRECLVSPTAEGPLTTFRANLEDPSDDAIDAAADRVQTHHAAVLDEMRRAYAPGDARPASARVADHIDRLGGLVDALWNPQLEKLRAKIASATVVDRRRPG